MTLDTPPHEPPFADSAADDCSCAGSEPAAFLLGPDGAICDCNAEAERLFGFVRDDLVQHNISMLFPQLSGVDLVEEERPNHQLSFRSHIGQPFQFEAICRNGNRFTGEIFLADLANPSPCRLRLIVCPLPDR